MTTFDPRRLTIPPADLLSPRLCDHRSVGVVIADADRSHLLMFDRARFPIGLAPVAGHVDDHGTSAQAAAAEAREEVGLQVGNLTLFAGGWIPNICRRTPVRDGVGHDWSVYAATAVGELAPDGAEVRNVRWMPVEEVIEYAWLTVDWAAGKVSNHEWQSRPGLDPVWVRWVAYWARFVGRQGLYDLLEPHLATVSALWTPEVPQDASVEEAWSL